MPMLSSEEEDGGSSDDDSHGLRSTDDDSDPLLSQVVNDNTSFDLNDDDPNLDHRLRSNDNINVDLNEDPSSLNEVETNDVCDSSELVEEPYVGQIFTSWEEVDECFRTYAKKMGFGVLKGSSRKKPSVTDKEVKELRNYTWRCECSGKVDTRRIVDGRKVAVGKKGVTFRVRKSKKCQCPVKLYAVVEGGGVWRVRNVILKHEGHVPNPNESRFITQHRQDNITDEIRRFVENGDAVGIPLPQLHRALAKARNGLDNLGLTVRDLRNMLSKGKKLKLRHGDATAMLSYFKRMSKDNNMFFHMERYDEFDRLQDVMWVDARSRVAYEDFGDVVTFDTTYITNKFHLPFANFVGVNHHGQSILLGCALISREDAETFEWLFSTWLECMGGVHPDGILTDQCAAMRKALKVVMPNTRHRWCLWHILMKVPVKLKGYKNYDKMKDELLSVVYDSFTPDEFDDNWREFVAKHNLQENNWLAGLFLESDMWVPAYLKHMFWAGMRSTQRSESINSFFKGYVKKHTKLHEFAEQYFRALECRVNDELAADAESSRCPHQSVTVFRFEEAFRKIYTNNMFRKYLCECSKASYVNLLDRVSKPGGLIDHLLEDRVYIYCKSSKKEIPTLRTRQYIVTYNHETKEAWCVCKHFECHGIMCRHLVRVYDVQKVTELPQMFILKRWRKDVKRKHSLVKVAYHDPTKTEEAMRHDRVLKAFETLCLQAATSAENEKVVLDVIQSTSKMLLRNEKPAADNVNPTPPSSVASNKRVVPDNTPSSIPGCARVLNFDEEDLEEAEMVRDPPAPKKPKHRTTDSRYKSEAEKNSGKGKGKKKNCNPETKMTEPATQQHNYPLGQLHYFSPLPGWYGHANGGPQVSGFNGGRQFSGFNGAPEVTGLTQPSCVTENAPQWSVGGIGLTQQQGSVGYFTQMLQSPIPSHLRR